MQWMCLCVSYDQLYHIAYFFMYVSIYVCV